MSRKAALPIVFLLFILGLSLIVAHSIGFTTRINDEYASRDKGREALAKDLLANVRFLKQLEARRYELMEIFIENSKKLNFHFTVFALENNCEYILFGEDSQNKKSNPACEQLFAVWVDLVNLIEKLEKREFLLVGNDLFYGFIAYQAKNHKYDRDFPGLYRQYIDGLSGEINILMSEIGELSEAIERISNDQKIILTYKKR